MHVVRYIKHTDLSIHTELISDGAHVLLGSVPIGRQNKMTLTRHDGTLMLHVYLVDCTHFDLGAEFEMRINHH